MNIIQVGRPAVSRYHQHSVIVTGGLGPRKNDCFHMFDRKVAVASGHGAPGREVVGPPGPLELTRTLNTSSFF